MTLGRLLLVLFYLILVAGGWLAGHWLTGFALIDVRPSNEPEIHRIVMLATSVYIAASAIPFVPGAEIGFALILALGDRIVFLVYIAMVTALLLAFLVGRFLPSKAIAGAFRFVGFERARNLVLRLEPLDSEARVAMLAAQAPTRIVPFLLRHRYVVLAVALNLPGNTLIGGGGGIALVAGLSGLYSTWGYAVTVAVAAAPVPLLVLFAGYRPAG